MNKLSKDRKKARVQIAKDALRLMNTPGIVVSKGVYVSIDLKDETINLPEGNLRKLRKKLDKFLDQDLPFHTDLIKDAKYTECEVCALGALLLADIDRRNKVTVNSMAFVVSFSEVEARLSDYFTVEELRRIEEVFEDWLTPSEIKNSRLALYVENNKEIDTPEERLRLILTFIIESDGKVL